MIKQISLILAIFMISFAFVSAQTNSTTELINPGTAPNSALYFLDIAMENLGLALTFDNDAQIEKELDIAEERLAEAKEMALQNNLEAMAKAEEKHSQTLTKIKSRLKKVSADNSTEKLKKELRIEQRINSLETKVKAVKDELKLEIKIKGKITPEQQQKLDELIASFEGKTGEVEIEIENKKGKTKIEIGEETGENEDEIEDELQEELEIEDNNEIEIEVENGVAKIKVEINDKKQEFEMNVNNNYTEEQIREQVMNEIANRYSISLQEAKKVGEIEFEREDEENEEGQNGLDEELEEDEENENSDSEESEENNSSEN